MSKFVALLSIVSVLALTACDDAGYYPSSATNNDQAAPANDEPLIVSGPPAPKYEPKPTDIDPPHQIWIPGYWEYNGTGYNWISGKVVDRPSPTAVWSSDHWIKHTYGWAFVPGYWQ